METTANLSTIQLSNTPPINDKSMSEKLVKDECRDNDDAIETADDSNVSYRPRPQLPKPLVVMRTLASLMMDLDKSVLDVDPEYQRKVIWPADRMTGLINSLMENFYIPPIILNKKQQEKEDKGEGVFVFTCVDGKQRLSSVRAFIKGMIPCHDHRGDKWWFCDPTSSRQKQVLPDDTKNVFLAKEFVSIEFFNLSPQQEEDLFARVQMGIQLSAAEKMRATSGPWQELAKLFVEDFPAVYSLMKDRNRGKDFQLTLSCFSQIIEVMNPSAASGIPVLKTSHTVLPKLLNNKGAVDDAIKSQLANIWKTFADLIRQDPSTFTNENLYLKGVQTFAPVEMVAVTVLISIHSKTRDNRLLLGNIRALRTALREYFTDLRLNINLWKFIWGSIRNLQADPLDRNARSTHEDLLPKPSTSESFMPKPTPRSAIPTLSSTEKRISSTAQVETRVVPSQSTSYASKREGENSGSSSTRIAQKRQRLNVDLPNNSSEPGNNFAETGHVARQPNQGALSAKSLVAPGEPVRRKTFAENEYAVFQAISNMAPALQSAPLPAMSTQSPKKILESASRVAPNLRRPARKGLQATCTASNFTMSNLSKETFSLLQSQPSKKTSISKSSHLPANDVPINPVSFGSQYSTLPPTTQIGKISVSDVPGPRPPTHSSTTTLQGGQSRCKMSTFLAGLGAFNSFPNEEQWSGVLRSPSPQMPTLSRPKALLFDELHSSIVGSSTSTGPSQQPLPETNPQRSWTLLDPTKPTDFVDLTGDTEN